MAKSVPKPKKVTPSAAQKKQPKDKKKPAPKKVKRPVVGWELVQRG